MTATLLALGFLWTVIMLIGISVAIFIYRDLKRHFKGNEGHLIEFRKRLNF